MTAPGAGYAAALLKASRECGCTERVAEDLRAADELLSRCSRFFYNPEVKAKDKADALAEALEGNACELTVQFAVLLAQRQKLKYLPDIRRRFDKLADAELGRTVVRVKIPFEMSSGARDRLEDYLIRSGLAPYARADNTKFEITIDKSLIGGFIAESEGRMLDMSLKTRLVRLRRAALSE